MLSKEFSLDCDRDCNTDRLMVTLFRFSSGWKVINLPPCKQLYGHPDGKDGWSYGGTKEQEGKLTLINTDHIGTSRSVMISR